MSEYIYATQGNPVQDENGLISLPRKEIVRCRDCKHLDDSEYSRWDNQLAECYGEPPLSCNLLSFNEWRMDGDKRVAETAFAEVELDDFCAWGERKVEPND